MNCRVENCNRGIVLVEGRLYHCVCPEGIAAGEKPMYSPSDKEKKTPIKLLPLPGYLRPQKPEVRVGRELAAGKDE